MLALPNWWRRGREGDVDAKWDFRAKWDPMFVGVLVLLSWNRTDVAPQLRSLYAKPRAPACLHMLVGPAPLVLNHSSFPTHFFTFGPTDGPFSMSWLHLAFVGASGEQNCEGGMSSAVSFYLLPWEPHFYPVVVVTPFCSHQIVIRRLELLPIYIYFPGTVDSRLRYCKLLSFMPFFLID